MSGIAGIIHFDGQPVAPGQVEAMTAAMPYRGPDGINHWHRGNVALGQCMLRTTPESLEETQPLTNEDESLVLVMDGRVDNWEELRLELLGKRAALRTRADAELVLRAYETWGDECLAHIDGDFALVIWNARKQEVFCARDRVGSRPLTYYRNGSTLVFASELHAILTLPWIKRIPNDEVLAQYLANEWYARDETLWRDVMRLPQAHCGVARTSGLILRQYWAPDCERTLPCRTDDEYIEHYRALLFDVVRRMSRSTHPLACEVSGGLDSSAIFAVAETLRQQEQLRAPALNGYCLNFEHDPNADEMDYARAVGAHLGRPIQEIKPSEMPLAWYKEHARAFRDLPPYPNHAMLCSLETEAHAKGSRVILSGLGGDEWAGGGATYYAEAIEARRFRDLLRYFQIDTREAGIRFSCWTLLRHGIVPCLPKPLRDVLRRTTRLMSTTDASSKYPWLVPAMEHAFERGWQATNRANRPATSRVSQRRQMDLLDSANGLVDREMCERQRARNGLEMRRPFWSRSIIEASLATPGHLHCRANEKKWMHRRALQGLLPENVLQRTTKSFFDGTFSPILIEMQKHLIEEVLPRRQNWVSRRAVESMLTAVFDHPPSMWTGGEVWALWCLLGTDAVYSEIDAPGNPDTSSRHTNT